MSDLVQKLVGALEDLIGIADVAMRRANQDGAEYDRDDELAEARAALSAAKDGGWRPIETAPKDGAVVWAYNGEQGRMRWTSGDMPGGSWALWVWDDQVLAEVDPAPYQPTHWQPLPNPPKEQNT